MFKDKITFSRSLPEWFVSWRQPGHLRVKQPCCVQSTGDCCRVWPRCPPPPGSVCVSRKAHRRWAHQRHGCAKCRCVTGTATYPQATQDRSPPPSTVASPLLVSDIRFPSLLPYPAPHFFSLQLPGSLCLSFPPSLPPKPLPNLEYLMQKHRRILLRKEKERPSALRR